MPGRKKKQSTGTSARKQSSIKIIRPLAIAGIGASAGGLEALREFFSHIPEKSNMAFIVVVHLKPDQPSMLPELLQNTTEIPVTVAKDGQEIAGNHAYIAPPAKSISVYNNKIQLLDLIKDSSRLPIDAFLFSLASDQENNAAAVILSGSGTDGSLGAREIKSNHGLVVVQTEESAAYGSMPQSVKNTGVADLILPPKAMPEQIIEYFSHTRKMHEQGPPEFKPDEKPDWLNKIFAILRSRLNYDFSAYKTNTIYRRINRRMGLNRIDSHNHYVRFLQKNPAEIEALFRELLIGVTSFFRDPESFEALKKNAMPLIMNQISEDGTLRAWIPGCSTGEEVYSLAIVLNEYFSEISQQINLQLFGTDIDSHAIQKAREGVYPAGISAEVSEQRLKRFFTKEGNFYRIRKNIRESVVFSVQNILKDPPFSRLNLLCCRNVLIYFNSETQKNVIPLFHYTLKSGAILMLGSSETIGGFTNLFVPLDKKWKIYRSAAVSQPMHKNLKFPSDPTNQERTETPDMKNSPKKKDQLSQVTVKAILDQFTPAVVVVDGAGEMIHVQGRVGKFLEQPGGPPTHNILNLAREGLKVELSSALRAARMSGQPVIRKEISVKINGGRQLIDLHVAPQHAPPELAGRFLVAFKEIAEPEPPAEESENRKGSKSGSRRIKQLEEELQETRENHQTTVEELESSNEELKSTNEELQSSNEELQSTNEELESSKEELQSLNEELQTVNAELQSNVEELSAARDDMRNLLNSTEIATIFVDNDLRIRRFTPEVTKIINLIPTDIGRPLEHVKSNLTYGKMKNDLIFVLDKLSAKEIEVRTENNEWYKMRIMPYRTTDNRIDGAVVTFSSIDHQKKNQEKLQALINEVETAQELIRNVFDMNSEPLLVLDENMKFIIANKAFTKIMNLKQEEIVGKHTGQFEKKLPKAINLSGHLNKALEKNHNFVTESFELKKRDGRIKYKIHGNIIRKKSGYPLHILLRFEEDRN